MTGQIEGDIVTRGSRPNYNGFLSDIPLPGRIFKGVYDLAFEFVLWWIKNQRRVWKEG